MKKIFITLCLMTLFPLQAFSQRGKNPLGPDTLGQPTSATSGQLRSRSTDITGEGMATATGASSDTDVVVPSRNPETREAQAQEESMVIREAFPVGPYKDGVYIIQDNE